MEVKEEIKVVQTPLPKVAVFVLFLTRLIDQLAVSSAFHS
jgi:hypothetical protein